MVNYHVKQVEPTDKELDQVDPEQMVSVQTRKKKLESEAFARAAAKRRLTAMNTAKKFESDLKAVRERNWIRCPLCWAPVSVILKKVPHLSLALHQHDCLVKEALKKFKSAIAITVITWKCFRIQELITRISSHFAPTEGNATAPSCATTFCRGTEAP